ncbi:hypothetical protein DSM112329_02796 [Paraconexibacter sp. AEG42_29]|uniref:ATP-grasp domain-containing protein n=2 Tax=Paraconexibacter sp. AEG42_29 TaxID=2997339 RepID=A0AAU7AWT3_9ACTN
MNHKLVRSPAPTSDSEAAAALRGWMMTTAQYAKLHASCAARGVRLLTDPDQYARAHHLPGWQATFAELTPHSVWLPLPVDVNEAVRTVAQLAGSAIVKDYVKTVKHLWDTAVFIPDTKDPVAVRDVIKAFLRERDDQLQGGLVFRTFERWQHEELRSWWLHGELVLLSAHPDTPHATPAHTLPIAQLSQAVRTLGCPLVTVDLVRSTDGDWRVVEVGDAQVSGLPSTTEPGRLLDALITPS